VKAFAFPLVFGKEVGGGEARLHAYGVHGTLPEKRIVASASGSFKPNVNGGYVLPQN